MESLPIPPRRSLPLTAGQLALIGLEFVAFPVGAALIGLLIMSGRDYCAGCGRYQKEMVLFSLPIETLGASVSRLNKAIALDADAVLAIGSAAPKNIDGSHVAVKLQHCPGCGSGFLQLLFIDKGMLTGQEEKGSDRQTVRLRGRLAGDLAEGAASKSSSS